MSSTRRELLLAAFSEKFKLIKIANGYEFDLNDMVFRGAYPITESDMPAINVLDGEEIHTGQYGISHMNMSVYVEAVAKVAPLTPHQASVQINRLLGAVLKAALEGDLTLGELAVETTYVNSTTLFPPEGGGFCGVKVKFLLPYKTKYNNPFEGI